MLLIGITNRKVCTNFYEQISRIAKTKLNYLIIREKDLNDEELLELSLMIKNQLKNTEIKIIINSNAGVAEKINADGIQISFKDFLDFNYKCLNKVMRKFGGREDNFSYKGKRYKMIGVSIHSFDEGIQAYNLGADYVIYGHIFETDCKKGIPARGVKEIEKLSAQIDIPIIGIGGIEKKNFREVLNSGASGIAIMSSLMKSKEPKELLEGMILRN